MRRINSHVNIAEIDDFQMIFVVQSFWRSDRMNEQIVNLHKTSNISTDEIKGKQWAYRFGAPIS